MKVGALISCILLLTLVFLLFSMAAQATEYRKADTEVKAEDILKHIENGEDIYLENCSISKELNISRIDLLEQQDPYPHIYNLTSYGIDKSLKVVDSNITILNSTFKDSIDFSNSYFKRSVSFAGSNFLGEAKFQGSSFNPTHIIAFNSTSFKNQTNFEATSFGNCDFRGTNFTNVNFILAYFFNNADFRGANISKADFNISIFDNNADFRVVNISNAKFIGAHFKFANFNGAHFDDVDFRYSKFNHHADFSNASFHELVIDSDAAQNIVVFDEETYIRFTKYFNSQGLYECSDTLYYNYRQGRQEKKDWFEISKYSDILTCFVCGYGVKPLNSFIFGTFFIFLFSLIYANPISLNKNGSEGIPLSFSRNIFLHKSSNKIIPFKFFLKTPGIVNSDKNKKASILDLFYYSICRFTFMSYENWYPRDDFRIFAVMEGVIGWATLGIFMATLTAVMIRS